MRLNDARALLDKRRYSGAYYVAGYAVECAFKACIAKKARRFEFPPKPTEVKRDYYTHELQALAKASGLLAKLESGGQLQEYWNTVRDWNEESRYDPRTGKRAKDILDVITNPKDGVLEYIKRYW